MIIIMITIMIIVIIIVVIIIIVIVIVLIFFVYIYFNNIVIINNNNNVDDNENNITSSISPHHNTQTTCHTAPERGQTCGSSASEEGTLLEWVQEGTGTHADPMTEIPRMATASMMYAQKGALRRTVRLRVGSWLSLLSAETTT